MSQLEICGQIIHQSIRSEQLNPFQFTAKLYLEWFGGKFKKAFFRRGVAVHKKNQIGAIAMILISIDSVWWDKKNLYINLIQNLLSYTHKLLVGGILLGMQLNQWLVWIDSSWKTEKHYWNNHNMGITFTLQGLRRDTMRTLVRWFWKLVLFRHSALKNL